MKLIEKFTNEKKAPLLTLVVTLVIFVSFALYLAFNIRMGISPDSKYHLEVSQAYSKVVGIPENTPDTYQWKDITRIPYLSFWVNGRMLNLNEKLLNFDQVFLLRIVNILTALGTLSFVYLLSKRLIKSSWGQILPTFLLSNTLMFVFLSSSINYDNLAILFCTAAIYFLVKYLQEPKRLSNSLLMFIFLLLGSLTKNSVLPLALILVIVWAVFLFKSNVLNEKFFKQFITFPNILLILIILILLLLNFDIYGVNLLIYNKLIPSCTDVLHYEGCLENGVFARSVYKIPRVFDGNMFEAVKLIAKGERIGPLLYLPYWIVEMSKKIFGIMGDRSLYMRYWYLPFYFMYFFMGIYLIFQNRKRFKVEDKGLLVISIFYTLIVAYYVNYKAYITHDWPDLGLQGRYIFPVLAPMYVLFSKYFLRIENKKLLNILLGALILLFVVGNIGYFFLYVPREWFF